MWSSESGSQHDIRCLEGHNNLLARYYPTELEQKLAYFIMALNRYVLSPKEEREELIRVAESVERAWPRNDQVGKERKTL